MNALANGPPIIIIVRGRERERENMGQVIRGCNVSRISAELHIAGAPGLLELITIKFWLDRVILCASGIYIRERALAAAFSKTYGGL